MTDEELLERFAPRLRYDSNEQYFADSAAQWTDNPGNQLRRADDDGRPGDLLAEAGALTLDLLAPGAYADGTAVKAGDRIGCPRSNYREQYVALRMARPELNNLMYGRAVEVRGRQWLQYWLWYFYNDYSLALGAGLHEGDWEMIQLRMHGEQPDLAVYAQHTHAEKRQWPEVEKQDGRPVVYVARGSHASYFEPGFHATEVWYDLADGKRATPVLALEIIAGEGAAWTRWPGRWGDTRPRLPGGVHQPSPTAPCVHAQWIDPDTLLNEARTPKRLAPPAPPEVSITGADGMLRVDFDFTQRTPPPGTLVITVNSRDEAGVPPRTHTFPVGAALKGLLDTAIPLDPAKHYDVYASTTAGDPPVPSESVLTEIEPPRKVAEVSLMQRLVKALGSVVGWIRGHVTSGRAARLLRRR